jgi:hypothetical protein
MKTDVTKIWQLYESGTDYNNRLEPNYYDLVELCIQYVQGNQWIGLENEEFPKATFNYTKRVVDLFNSLLCSAKTGINIAPFATVDTDEEQELADMAKAAVESYMELSSYDSFKRECVRDALIMGDTAVHYYFDPECKSKLGEMGEIKREQVYGNNIIFGNPNSNKVVGQPYILIVGRDLVKNLKEEAEAHGNPTDEIRADEADEQGNFDNYEESDAEGYLKATYILKYEMEDGKLLVSKSTEKAIIYDGDETNQTRYPIAWLYNDKQYQCYHGRSLVADMLHNQNYINRAFSLMMYYTMSVAYGKPIYDADRIQGWTSELGVALGVKGLQPGQGINTVASNIAPSNMNTAVVSIIEMAIEYTKETIGLTDTLMGSVNPENKGAIAIVTKNSQSPLENMGEHIRMWTEEQVLIISDIQSAKYGTRKVVVEEEGERYLQEFNFDMLKESMLNVYVEIGESSFFGEPAIVQTLDNLFTAGIIDDMQLLERYPESQIPKLAELIEAKQQMMSPEATGDDSQALIDFYEQLPPETQAQIQALPQEQQGQAIRQLMQRR